MLRRAFAVALLISAPAAWVARDAQAGSASLAGTDVAGDAPFGARPFTLLGSVGSGYGHVTGGDYGEAPGGAQALMGLSAATQLARWELEGGVGWLYSGVLGRSLAGDEIRIRSRMGLGSAGLRYRLGRRWQLGPQVDVAFGTDTSFGPTVGHTSVEMLAGAKALYELSYAKFPIRVWSQLSATVAHGDHLLVALAGLELGIPVGWPWHASAAKPRDVIVSTSAAPEASAREVRVVLDGQRVFFGTASTRLRSSVERALRDVGKYLSARPASFGLVRVDGHADSRGKFEMNLKLSERRARAVGRALASGGIESEALATQGHSYLEPLDRGTGRVAWARNRRVEIVFEDVQDPAGLRKALAPLASEAPRDNR
jgi:outer membrane protein OmpA-like peptidoglycan-associated protein